jgi:hypothetical protein
MDWNNRIQIKSQLSVHHHLFTLIIVINCNMENFHIIGRIGQQKNRIIMKYGETLPSFTDVQYQLDMGGRWR